MGQLKLKASKHTKTHNHRQLTSHYTTQQETLHTQAWCPFPKPELQLYSRSPARFTELSQGQKKNMHHVVEILTQTVTLDITRDADLWQEIGPPCILTRNLGSISSFCSAFKNKRIADPKSWALKSPYKNIFHNETLNESIMNEHKYTPLLTPLYSTSYEHCLAPILNGDIFLCPTKAQAWATIC